MSVSPEQEARRERSITLLRSKGIPVLPELPVIESPTLRPARAAAERAAVLCAIAVHAEMHHLGKTDTVAHAFLSERDLWNAVTPQEHAFLTSPNPSEHDLIQFVWRYESCWALTWALGWLSDLAFPSNTCDVPRLAQLFRDMPDQPLFSTATLRPESELLDALDLTYRCHWAVVDQRLARRSLPGLEPGVVYERHYALNWLTGYEGQDWDNVSTDT